MTARPTALASDPGVPTPAVEVKKQRDVDLIIGFDFGTSCSKVVIGDPDWQAQSFAVNFQTPASELQHWLLPTRLKEERNLKMRLMESSDSREIRDLVAIYFAEVIQRSYHWFINHSPADYRQVTANWSLVVGFPEKEFGNSPLSKAYEDIAHLAAKLCLVEGELTLATVQAVRDSPEAYNPFFPQSRIRFYPEIAAQLAGYVNSPFRKQGNLLLIDVGAGTLDVSTLILHGDQTNDIVSFHVCDVKPLGVLRLLEDRLNRIRETYPGIECISLAEFLDTLRPSPEDISELTDSPDDALREVFEQTSVAFAEKVILAALACLTQFRMVLKEVHTNGSFDPWGKNLRFFFTGGGSRSAFYRNNLADGPLEKQLTRFTRWQTEQDRRRHQGQGLRIERLPTPEKLLNFPEELHPEFDRLSVAHGLAFGGPNLMKITRSSLS